MTARTPGLGSGIPPTSRRLSVAPMMNWTDRHFRFFIRQITRRALLYTEMVNMNALVHGDLERHLGYSPDEHPVALQLGGDEPRTLARCARLAEEWGYDEVNLNVGCPSERVQSGNFGACLMADPERVKECLSAMGEAVAIPVTVKHRIGIDELDTYDHLADFVAIVSASGAARFTVHARKAWLKGLSPRENREIPPLRYEDVFRIKRDFPHLQVELNGGVRSLADARSHLERVDAVMLGRAAYEDPYLLAGADAQVFGASVFGDTEEFGDTPGDASSGTTVGPSRREVVERVLPYIESRLDEGVRLNRMTRHMLGLFTGRPGAKAWRRHLSEHAHLDGADGEVLLAALRLVPDEVADERPAPADGPSAGPATGSATGQSNESSARPAEATAELERLQLA
jgi:tRNA-dihydrouridine synthase A